MPTCPTCGTELSTRAGMRQHHTTVHGEPLANRTCTGCGAEFYDPKARLEFCEECGANAGEHNGNWSDATERADCKRCGETFEYYPSNKAGVYCPECVAESEAFLGEPHRADADRVTKECDFCDCEMTVLQSRLERGEGRFCGFECLCDWMAKDGRAETTDYGENWKPVKRRALERDDHSCQNCGKTADQLGQEPDVHHITPIKTFDEPKEGHTLDNVICLCRSCHRRVEAGSIHVSDD